MRIFYFHFSSFCFRKQSSILTLLLKERMVRCLVTGKRMINPVVLCLNMLNCTVDEAEQAKIRFQFAVFNADVKHWEYCHVSRTILELKSYTDIISLGYRDLSIVDRHLKKNGEVVLMVKIQIIQYESEKHNLSQVSILSRYVVRSKVIYERVRKFHVKR